MDAGALDRRIELRRAISSRDALKGPAPVWHTLATVWASYEPVSDVERVRAQQTGAVITARFVIRWSSDVADLNAKDELRFDGALYAIAAVKPIGRRLGLEITASAKAD